MKRILVCLALILCLAPPTHGADYNPDNYRRAKPFMDGMLNMMDRMGLIDLGDYPDRNGTDFDWNSSWHPQPYDSYPAPPYGAGAVPGMPAQSMPPPPRGPAHPLDGVWQGRSGEILMIRDGRFRIYVTRDRYRQGRLRLKGDTLYMHDPQTRTTNRYEYATHKDRLVLRDAEDRLLLYRRLR